MPSIQVFVVPLAVLAAVILIWKLPETYRARRLRTLIPNALVLQSGPNADLVRAISRIGNVDLLRRKLPAAGFSIVATEQGISLWRGLGFEFLSVEWAAVSGFTVGDINDTTQTVKGIILSARAEHLPFVIYGRGPFGALAIADPELGVIVAELERRRGEGATANPAA